MNTNPDKPLPPSEPMMQCPRCGWEVDDEILTEQPDCPHGWQSLEGLNVADLKALFADDDELSIDPVIDEGGLR